MDEQIPISVVVPTYNRGALIARALGSILHQTYAPAEIIVIDDGSTDNTREETAAFGPRVTYVHQQNAGASEARNHGVRLARHTWIAFLDSDDVWLPSHLENITHAIHATNGRAVMYFSNMKLEQNEGEGTLWDIIGFDVEGQYRWTDDATEWVMMGRQPMMLQTGVCRKEEYLALGGLWSRLRTRHDTHFFIKLGTGRPMCAVRGCGTQQTSDENPANRLMSAWGPGSWNFWLESIPMYEDLLTTVPALPEAHRQTLKKWMTNGHWRLFRFAWKEHKPLAMLTHLFSAIRTQPSEVARIVANALRRKETLSSD